MKSTEAFPSNYLKTADVSGNGETYVMSTVIKEKFTDPETKETEEKPVLSFEDTEKSLILNKTNWKRIAKIYGDNSEAWRGQKIKLRLESVESFGETVDAIRVTNPD